MSVSDDFASALAAMGAASAASSSPTDVGSGRICISLRVLRVGVAKEWWRQQVREEMFRARCVLARALRDDEAAYGGVELLMAAEVQRRKDTNIL